MHPPAQDLLKLRELPELEPPPGVWERVLEAHTARTAARRFRRRSLAAAAAVALAVGATLYLATRSDAPLSPTVASIAPPPSEPAGLDAVSYAPLVAESARLERLLAELPSRPLKIGATAGTIVGLEDRIAVVDAQLSYAAAQDLAPTYREALWSERVELMNALLYVRFAETQAY